VNYESQGNDTRLLFLKSAFSNNGGIEHVVKWLCEQNRSVNVDIEQTTFSKLNQWYYDEDYGSIRHNSGRYFTIDGINVKTNWGVVGEWEQPIINQPEIGYLGIITKEFDGILHFLMQAKIEPGNVNYVQLSPTLQATKSNYSQVHKGKKPLYLEYFQNAQTNQILLDQLQSEQGARFLKKRNRNIIIKVEDDIDVHDNFIWLTLRQIKQLIQHDNLVNMDTRTVISGIPFGSYDDDVISSFDFFDTGKQSKLINNAFMLSTLSRNGSLHSFDGIIQFLTRLKSKYDLEIRKIDLNRLTNWVFEEREIHHIENKYFKIIAVDVQIGNREVVRWNQPMVQPAQDGICAFVCKEINGVLHFAVQAKPECGNRDIIELAPTVQCLTGNYRETKEGALPFLEYVLTVPGENIIYDTMQSEEGGRFFKEQNRNMIVMASAEISTELPENYIWITLNQLHTFLKFNNYLNIQARSLIAAVSFI